MARFGDFQRSSQRLMRLGFVPIGYTDSRRRRLYANPIRVRQGDARPWASVGAGGDVEYYASKPADGNTGANGGARTEASIERRPGRGYALTERGRLWTFAVAKEPTS